MQNHNMGGTVAMDYNGNDAGQGRSIPLNSSIHSGLGNSTVIFDDSILGNTPTGSPTTIHENNDKVCVGWLLAVMGPLRGKSYELHLGQNSIGRGSTNAICLTTDTGVSTEAQLIVTYDPVDNEYEARPGNSRAISRVNNARLNQAVILKVGDLITLSKETQLRFIPACDASFSWPDEI